MNPSSQGPNTSNNNVLPVVGLLEWWKEQGDLVVLWWLSTMRHRCLCGYHQKVFKPGLIIHSDTWGGHITIKRIGYNCQHRRFNHTEEFVNYHNRHGTHRQHKALGAHRNRVSHCTREMDPICRSAGLSLRIHVGMSQPGNLWKALLEGLAKVRMPIPESLHFD